MKTMFNTEVTNLASTLAGVIIRKQEISLKHG